MNCSDCKYYFKENKECHRFPPQVVFGTVKNDSQQPECEEWDWCGEFKQKRGKKYE